MAQNNLSAKDKSQVIKPETPEMEALLQVGYPDLSVSKAELIIRERKANPASWPYEQMERAEAFLAGYHGKSRPIDTSPGWKRQQVA